MAAIMLRDRAMARNQSPLAMLNQQQDEIGAAPMIADSLTLVIASHLVIAVADRVPVLNVEQTCRGAAQVAVPKADGQMPTAAEMRATCLGKENGARDQLVRQWTDFTGEHRTSCVRSTAAGGIPSYIELLTCLEISEQARKLPDEPMRGTTGVAPARR
jgi:hypothetical protein